jgi:hypothetical protein
MASLRRSAKQASIVALHEVAGAMNAVPRLRAHLAVGMPRFRDPSRAKNGSSDFLVRGSCDRGIERL